MQEEEEMEGLLQEAHEACPGQARRDAKEVPGSHRQKGEGKGGTRRCLEDARDGKDQQGT